MVKVYYRGGWLHVEWESFSHVFCIWHVLQKRQHVCHANTCVAVFGLFSFFLLMSFIIFCCCCSCLVNVSGPYKYRENNLYISHVSTNTADILICTRQKRRIMQQAIGKKGEKWCLNARRWFFRKLLLMCPSSFLF